MTNWSLIGPKNKHTGNVTQKVQVELRDVHVYNMYIQCTYNIHITIINGKEDNDFERK